MTHTNRQRRWAEGCPQKHARRIAQCLESYHRNKQGLPRRARVTNDDRRKALEGTREKQFVCGTCFNLPHRRAKTGCPECDLPHAP